MSKGKLLIVNAGVNGITKVWNHLTGEKEQKLFPPNIPIECSEEMGEYLLRKFCDPQMAIYFKSADGAALVSAPIEPDEPPTSEELEEEINGFIPKVTKAQAQEFRQKRKYTRRATK